MTHERTRNADRPPRSPRREVRDRAARRAAEGMRAQDRPGDQPRRLRAGRRAVRPGGPPARRRHGGRAGRPGHGRPVMKGGTLDRIVVLEKTIKPPARPATPAPSRLTAVAAAQLRALCLTADAGGGLDVLTADEA